MILLVDNYDSFTYNLAQYIGEFSEVKVLRNDDRDLYDVAEAADKIVFSPGPGWPADAGRMEEMIRDFAGKKPILGICLGHQAIAEVFGGKLDLAQCIMHGKTSMAERLQDTPLLAGIPKTHEIMRYHSIVISEMPADFDILSYRKQLMTTKLWRYNIKPYRFLGCNIIQKVLARLMGLR